MSRIIAINRLLTRDGNIKESLKKRLDETFGTTDWFDSFYTTTGQLSLFENSPQREKTVDCEAKGRVFKARTSLALPGINTNSTGIPFLVVNN